ncbi:hypothetical protein H6F43_04085 [Leptolyngbya sp. FACHB-36]|uniref:hypothetical protein n=1 Tax=Leptolyngbya sp. FACHB-36 TaxID=2692808 RepID=UPI001680058A|nr:hypothetical protein [Leptolyngbya sp. FACHB-36]MBD2019362.1 hypothetical protein [Leptolyngbya sp. FACHB-36]
MPLPPLPSSYQSQVYAAIVGALPGRWFHKLPSQTSPLHPLLWGLAGVLAHVRLSYERSLAAAIPMRSGGPWLSLHLASIGLRRKSGETDEQAKTRYQWEFKPTRNTRIGELNALSHYLGVEPPELRLEGDRSSGRFGQFRVVIRSTTKKWVDVDFSFVGEFVRKYVSNGIIPSIDVSIEPLDNEALSLQSLPPWRFSHSFPMSRTVLGPLWERPILISPIRLPFARVLIAKIAPESWRNYRGRLEALLRDAIATAPGALFLYISDPIAAPYLTAAYDLQLTTSDPNQTFPPKPWVPDGYRFTHSLTRIAPSDPKQVAAPFLSVSIEPLVIPSAPPVNLPELHEIYSPFPGDTQTPDNWVVHYEGVSFTQFKVLRFLDVALPNPTLTSPRLDAMKTGPWTLAITEGSTRWGNAPPNGTQLTALPFTERSPDSIWWTDEAGKARSATPLWDGQAVYLALEFIYPKAAPRTIRELELRLQGNRVEYRRTAIPVDDRVSAGFIFKVRASGVTVA